MRGWGDDKCTYNFGNPERKRVLDLSLDGIIILKWILGNWGWRVRFGFAWLRIGTSDGL